MMTLIFQIYDLVGYQSQFKFNSALQWLLPRATAYPRHKHWVKRTKES